MDGRMSGWMRGRLHASLSILPSRRVPARWPAPAVRLPSPELRPGRPHLSAPLRPAAPFPAAPPRAGPGRRRTSSGSAVAAGRRVGAPSEPGLKPSRGLGSSGDPRRRGQWDRDGRGDRDHLPGRRKDIPQEGPDVCGALHRNAPEWEEIRFIQRQKQTFQVQNWQTGSHQGFRRGCSPDELGAEGEADLHP